MNFPHTAKPATLSQLCKELGISKKQLAAIKKLVKKNSAKKRK